MGVQLREKKMKDGQISFYLDIYHNKHRWYEFLDIHISKTKPTDDDREKKRLANEIKVKRENELTVQDNGLIDRSKRKADFVEWFDQYMKDRGLKCTNNISTLIHIRRYMDGKPLPFNTLTPEWVKAFTKYLLTLVSANTAKTYLKNLNTAFEDAVRQSIILQNPLRLIPRHERLKKKPVFRNAYSLDQLQQLFFAPCDIEPQYRQGYMFSCFTGLRWSDVYRYL